MSQLVNTSFMFLYWIYIKVNVCSQDTFSWSWMRLCRACPRSFHCIIYTINSIQHISVLLNECCIAIFLCQKKQQHAIDFSPIASKCIPLQYKYLSDILPEIDSCRLFLSGVIYAQPIPPISK